MRTSELSAETKRIVCADMLGVIDIPLTEVRYYHHARENPAMKCTSLFILNETHYGISVGCYDIGLATVMVKNILQNVVKFCRYYLIQA